VSSAREYAPAEPSSGDQGRPLFQHEIRRDGRIVAILRGHTTPAGVTVDSEVYPLSQPAGGDPVLRPFIFTTLDQAHRFADEALVAFEYLNCTVA
jgi:hypothetical protein